jgi:ADP-ribose pyrophosphatase YjhB (NUDIX family)
MLTTQQYSNVLDHIAVGCVDVAVVCKGKLLLEQRAKDPIKNSWWIFGGRIFINETFQQTARRGVLRELKLDIQDETRFIQLPAMNLRWPTRHEDPVENGCHHILLPHYIELTDSEKLQIDQVLEISSHKEWFNLDNADNNDLLPEIRLIMGAIKVRME